MQFNALYMCHRPSKVKTMKNDPQLLNLWIESLILLIRVGMHGGLTLEGQSLGYIILELEPIWRSFIDAPLLLYPLRSTSIRVVVEQMNANATFPTRVLKIIVNYNRVKVHPYNVSDHVLTGFEVIPSDLGAPIVSM